MAYKLVTLFLLLLLFFFFLPLKSHSSSTPQQSWVKAGYYYSGSETVISEINSKLFTHLICAFAYINSSTYHLSINSSTEQRFSTFTDTIKRKNPSITTLLSIWVGREFSSTFFSMINQSSYRNSFIQSSIQTARLHGFHGLDLFLFGILPNKSSYMANLATLLNEWRVAVDSDAKKTLATEGCSWSWPAPESTCQIWVIQRVTQWSRCRGTWIGCMLQRTITTCRERTMSRTFMRLCLAD
jgi:hypothetical protein